MHVCVSARLITVVKMLAENAVTFFKFHGTKTTLISIYVNILLNFKMQQQAFHLLSPPGDPEKA